MQVEKITQTVLTASEGHRLTNGVAYGVSVVLGVGDSPDNWREITEEEYDEVVKEEEMLSGAVSNGENI